MLRYAKRGKRKQQLPGSKDLADRILPLTAHGEGQSGQIADVLHLNVCMLASAVWKS